MKRTAVLVSMVMATACGVSQGDVTLAPDSRAESDRLNTQGSTDLNLAAGSMLLYEVQVRTANACSPDVGAQWQREACARKVAPQPVYRAQGMSCGELPQLQKIRLGTLDDMLANTDDFRAGITVRYVNEKVGANTLWLMPPFPNNDTWALPDACDNLGSPYAVRDYLHASGSLSRACIGDGRDEYSARPCWANGELEQVISAAHARGMKVMLDVAFNHFGHNYLLYDYVDYQPVRERARSGEDLNRLWDFGATDEGALVRPDVLDTPAKLDALAARAPAVKAQLDALKNRCPALTGDALVRGFALWREAFDFERSGFDCANLFLEFNAPGFYLGANRYDPATRLGDNFTNNWVDVKFLFHHEENLAKQWEFVRTREYLFRVLNYWVSRGVDGFRLDHTTDFDSGLGSNEWKYITTKVDYYASRRGQARPVFLAEEFGDQLEMNKVVDVMTEGYVGDLCGRGGRTKDTAYVEGVLENMNRFDGRVFTMTALETHDERRLVDGTGFNAWTGAGFWGLGATTRSTPMMLMGQELGEGFGLAFRRSDFLRSRFEGSQTWNPAAPALAGYYQRLATERLRYENRALLAPRHWYLRSRWTGQADPRIFAQAKWSGDGNVMFVFHNLWEQDVEQAYFIPPELGGLLNLRDGTSYRLYDVLSGQRIGGCLSGADLKWQLYVKMDRATRAQWLRLEQCD